MTAEYASVSNVKLYATINLVIFAFFAITGLQPVLATHLSHTDGVRVDSYIFPGITQAAAPNFKTAARIHWTRTPETTSGVTRDGIARNASRKGIYFPG